MKSKMLIELECITCSSCSKSIPIYVLPFYMYRCTGQYLKLYSLKVNVFLGEGI